MTRAPDRPPKLLRSLVRRFGYDLIERRASVSEDRDCAIVGVEHEGVRYRMLVVDPRDTVQACHWRGALYEPEELALIAARFPRGGTFVDVGANVGNHAVYVARALAAGRVVAYEPAPETHAVLAFNVAMNDDAGVVALRRVGVSDRAGAARLSDEGTAALGRASITDDPAGRVIEVVRLDDDLGDAPVDFVKIDVERHEMAALAGMSAIAARQRPVMLVEVDDAVAADFLGWVDAAGYRVAERLRRYPVNENFLIEPAALA